METKNSEFVTLRMTREAWEVISETLQADMQASNFEKSLRDDISEAYDSIEVNPLPQEPVIVFRDEAFNYDDWTYPYDDVAVVLTINSDYDDECPHCAEDLSDHTDEKRGFTHNYCAACDIDWENDTMKDIAPKVIARWKKDVLPTIR